MYMSTSHESRKWWSSGALFFLAPICLHFHAWASEGSFSEWSPGCPCLSKSSFFRFSQMPPLWASLPDSQMWPLFSLNSFCSLLDLFYALYLNYLLTCLPSPHWSVGSSGAWIVTQYYSRYCINILVVEFLKIIHSIPVFYFSIWFL